ERPRDPSLIDLCVLVEHEAADASGRDAGLERATRVAVELAVRKLALVEREHERAAARVADVAELAGEARPELGRAARERREPGRLGIGREHSCRHTRRAAACLAALEHADAQAALLRTPGGGE